MYGGIKLKRSAVLLCLMALCIVSACTNESNNGSGFNPTTNVSNESTNNDSTQLKTNSFLNLDQLEQYHIVTGSSKEYTKADMVSLAKDDMQKDYVGVIKNYLQQELGQEASYLDSVDGTYNPRKVVVGTTDGNTYMFELRKWYMYNGIWTVSSYAQVKDEGAVPPEQTIKYELIDAESVSDQGVQKEINEKIMAKSAGHYHFTAGDKLYVLLVAGKEQSVELLNVFGNDYLMKLQYTTIENKDPRFGENPYLLLKLEATIMDLFVQQYSETKIDDIRLNMP